MVRIHTLGFPRIGRERELKLALESYWQGSSGVEQLLATAAELRLRHWQQQRGLDWVPVGDFSLYDHVLDMSVTLGSLPRRACSGDPLADYFRAARGRAGGADDHCVHAAEMTKWFDTNYHYLVPELYRDSDFSLNPQRLLDQFAEAQALGVKGKVVVLGPVSYLWLSKTRDGSDRLDLLERLLPVYAALLQTLADAGVEWVQIDEPVLVTDLAPAWRQALVISYRHFQGLGPNKLLTSYFGPLGDNLTLAASLPVQGWHIDCVSDREQGWCEVHQLKAGLGEQAVLSLGVIDGRNVWKTDINATLDRLEPLVQALGERLWLAPSCSLLHVPYSLGRERAMEPELRSWLAFAEEKIDELQLLRNALHAGRAAFSERLKENADALAARRNSSRVKHLTVRQALANLQPDMGQRKNTYARRAAVQKERLKLPSYPTTTIGSFPQTRDIRQLRQRYKTGEISRENYEHAMQGEIALCIAEQEALGLDVLVHGEAERNDMVEYFGQQLEGYGFSQFGWVQSYGSRCVKPPILFGDIRRPGAMTVAWTRYAQSLTSKPVKGMLTGPVTMLNWSFVRDDQPRRETCLQLALAIREEVQALEAAGVAIIQIDEAALREGLPLRRSQWQTYLDWAIASFRLAANGVADTTQIHTHMCYSEFNDIIDSIAAMDADVITIETSRSNMALLDVFEQFNYPNEIGPGVYDIHSPNTPSRDEIVQLINRAETRLPAERLWVNPDCGLKTRSWEEVLPALRNMVAAARVLRTCSVHLPPEAS